MVLIANDFMTLWPRPWPFSCNLLLAQRAFGAAMDGAPGYFAALPGPLFTAKSNTA